MTFEIHVILADGSKFSENEWDAKSAYDRCTYWISRGVRSVECQYVENMLYYHAYAPSTSYTTSKIEEFYDVAVEDGTNEEDQYAENQVD